MKDFHEIGKDAADAFGIRAKHQKRAAVVLDILQGIFFFWKWFKNEGDKKEHLDDRGNRFGGDVGGNHDQEKS